MLTQDEKRTFKDNVNCSTTLENGVYVVYDTQMQSYDVPMCVPVSKLLDYFTIVVNDVNSKYYLNEEKYHLYRVGSFDTVSGIITTDVPVFINSLDRYIDRQKRNLQTIIQVLNYLPSGYFKMSEQQKRAIQDKIDSAITEYVANYVIPDLDVSKFDTEKVKDIYKHYDEMIKYRDSYYDDDVDFSGFRE